jgi:hypothetical protein
VKRWNRGQILKWEAKWFLPTGLATFAVVVLLIVAAVVISSVSGSGEAELLTKAHEHSSDVTLSSILEAIGFVLMVAPLYFLFRAAASRSDRMRYQLVGLVIAAPLFFAASAFLNAAATNEASDQFAAGEAKSTLTVKEAESECRSDLNDEGAKDFNKKYDEGKTPAEDCANTKVADDEAENALSDASTRGLATGFGLGGRLGLAVALFYSCLYAMRTGLLSRFWGSLGMALGVAALLLLVQFSLIFFLYFGLLLIGKIPGGRPPAWAAGEAIPWPSPGQKIAAQMEPSDPDAIDVDAVEEEEEPPSPPNGNGSGGPSGGGPRKRKRRG